MLNACIMSADFWGLKTAGGTATAYHLLAAVLSKHKNIKVSSPGTPPSTLGSSCCSEGAGSDQKLMCRSRSWG